MQYVCINHHIYRPCDALVGMSYITGMYHITGKKVNRLAGLYPHHLFTDLVYCEYNAKYDKNDPNATPKTEILGVRCVFQSSDGNLRRKRGKIELWI